MLLKNVSSGKRGCYAPKIKKTDETQTVHYDFLRSGTQSRSEING